jgi:hypothetical protein
VNVVNQLLTDEFCRAFCQFKVTVFTVFAPFATTTWALNMCRLLWCK